MEKISIIFNNEKNRPSIATRIRWKIFRSFYILNKNTFLIEDNSDGILLFAFVWNAKNIIHFLEHSSPCKFFQVWIVLIAFEAIIENWNTKTSLNTAIKEHIQQILLLHRVCVTYLKYNVYEKILLIKTACQSILNTDKCVAVAFTFKMYVQYTHWYMPPAYCTVLSQSMCVLAMFPNCWYSTLIQYSKF